MTDAAAPIVLVCTVGGSPQPVASALRALRPERVVFVVSDGKRGESSRKQVDDVEIQYDPRSGTMGPGLRHVEGCPGEVAFLPVPADDPDRTYALCLQTLTALRRDHATHRLIADYTGGTKSMTGGLLMAAFATEGAEVQFMLGQRPDLVQVTPGSEAPHVMSADLIQAERDFDAARQAVAGYDYAAAHRIISDITARLGRGGAKPSAARGKAFELARRWSSLMSQWDAFQHKTAAQVAFNAREGGEALGEAFVETGHYDFLQEVSASEKAPSWRLCADLWLNALRRAERGRYDDAIARLYRLVEAAAQAQLKQRYDLDSGRMPLDALPDEMRATAQRRKDHKTGACYTDLAQLRTYEFLAWRDPADPLVRAYAPDWRRGERMYGPKWLSARNNSILAHGFKTIDRQKWDEGRAWVAEQLRPFWSAVEPPQLPTRFPGER